MLVLVLTISTRAFQQCKAHAQGTSMHMPTCMPTRMSTRRAATAVRQQRRQRCQAQRCAVHFAGGALHDNARCACSALHNSARCAAVRSMIMHDVRQCMYDTARCAAMRCTAVRCTTMHDERRCDAVKEGVGKHVVVAQNRAVMPNVAVKLLSQPALMVPKLLVLLNAASLLSFSSNLVVSHCFTLRGRATASCCEGGPLLHAAREGHCFMLRGGVG